MAATQDNRPNRDGQMAGPNWFTDCSDLVVRHICRIASVAIPLMFAAVLWYANRIEEKTDSMQDALQQIQIDVAVIRGRQSPVTIPAPGPGIAMADK